MPISRSPSIPPFYGQRLNSEMARETEGMVFRDALTHNGKPALTGMYAQRLAQDYPGLIASKCSDGNHWHVEAQVEADTILPLDDEEIAAMGRIPMTTTTRCPRCIKGFILLGRCVNCSHSPSVVPPSVPQPKGKRAP